MGFPLITIIRNYTQGTAYIQQAIIPNCIVILIIDSNQTFIKRNDSCEDKVMKRRSNLFREKKRVRAPVTSGGYPSLSQTLERLISAKRIQNRCYGSHRKSSLLLSASVRMPTIGSSQTSWQLDFIASTMMITIGIHIHSSFKTYLIIPNQSEGGCWMSN